MMEHSDKDQEAIAVARTMLALVVRRVPGRVSKGGSPLKPSFGGPLRANFASSLDCFNARCSMPNAREQSGQTRDAACGCVGH